MKTYEEKIRLQTPDCDMKGPWRFSAVLEAFQEAAGAHCTALGCDRDTLVKQGIVWVLVRSEVRMTRYPRAGETVTLLTFHRPARHGMFPRYYKVTDADGNLVGQASTLWMLMSLETRQSVTQAEELVRMPDNSDIPAPMPFPGVIRSVEGQESKMQYRAVYTDLDINGHVNNAKYADWLCNLIGPEVLKDHEISTMILDYNAEIRPGQTVELILRHDEAGHYQLTGWVGGKKVFEIGAVLK